MKKILQFIKEKLRITSWQALVHLVVVEIILNVLWGWFSKMFTTPVIREIGFLIVFVTAMFAVAWYLPKLAPAIYGLSKKRDDTHIPARQRLEHDGVLWEDGGRNAWGNIHVVGPLCPKDFVPLAIQVRGNEMKTYINEDETISDYSKLVCPECKAEYTLGTNPKQIKNSHAEVASRLEGQRRRARQH